MWNTIISDNFNRSNGVVNNGWTETTSNTWAINNNKLTTVTSAGSILYRDSNNIDNKIVVETTSLTGFNILTTRFNSSTTNGYYCVLNKSTNITLTMGRWSNNGATLNTITTDTLVTNETKLIVEFWAISTYPTNLYLIIYDINGNVLKFVSGTDSTSELQTQTKVGVNFFSSDSSLASFDNILIANLVNNSIKPGNSKLVLSPYNWNVSNNNATTINPGSYFKCKFTGTYLELRTDITNYLSNGNTSYPKLKYFIDNKISNEITIDNSRIVIGNLTDTEHEIVAYVNNTTLTLDRWNTPLSTFVIKELIIDDSKEFKSITKYSNNILVLGDSITEGRAVESTDDFTSSYGYYLITGLNAEIGIIGYASSGYSNPGASNVPKASYNIDNYYSTITRLVNSKFSPIPNQIIINLGTNDALGNIPTNTVKTDIKLLVNKLISYSNRYTKITILIPFGGYIKSIITEVVNELNNKQIEIVDLNEYEGLNNTGNSYKSTDGIHPNIKYHAYLGNKLSNKLTTNNNKNKLLELVTKDQINLKFNDLINTKVVRNYLDYLTNN